MKKWQNDINFHEELRQCSISSYNPYEKGVPNGYKLVAASKVDPSTGFAAIALQKDDQIVISFRGTEIKKDDEIDLKNDRIMWIEKKFPPQLECAKEFIKTIESNPKLKNKDITLTGHSLGGSLAQFLSAMYGYKAVAFNPYGIKNILDKYNLKYKEGNIINYCSKGDIITSINSNNHIGKIYEMEPNSKEFNILDHMLEQQKPIEKQRVITPEELKRSDGIEYMKDKSINAIKKVGEETANYSYSRMQNDIKPYQNLLNILEKQSNNSEDLQTKIQNNKLFGGYRVNNGQDEVYVKEYKRGDGTVVKAHWRSYPGDFDPNKRLTDMQEPELGHALDFWMDEEKYIR